MEHQDIDNRFTYHKPTEDQIIRMAALREQARIFAHMIDAATPTCREQSLAITSLEDCVMRANAAIARHEGQPPIGDLPEDLNKLAEAYRRAAYRDAAAAPRLAQEWQQIQQNVQIPLAGSSGGVAGSGIMPVFPAFENEHPMLNGPDDLPGGEGYQAETVEKD
jgi:hypothetical protein